MGFKPPIAAESKRGADGCRWEITQIGGVWAMTVTVVTTDGHVTRSLSQAEIVALTTGTERTNTISLLAKCQNGALVRAGWIDDLAPDPT